MTADRVALNLAAALAATPEGFRLVRLSRLRIEGVSLDPAIADDGATQAAIDLELARLRALPELSPLLPLLDAPSHIATPPATAPTSPAGRRPISIWAPVEIGGAPCFERPPSGPFGDHHAARRRILESKVSGTRRAVFLGESVAAGYLYAPEHTPAGVLSATLAEAAGAPIEVIDLARTDETLSGLVDTALAALQLSPDILVCFAGNNWDLLERAEDGPLATTIEGRQRCGLALSTLGFVGAAEVCAWSLVQRVQEAFERIAVTGVPVVWVLPEVALGTWHGLQPPTWIPDLEGWYARYDAARAALSAGDPTSALGLSEEMIRLDGGGNATSLAFRCRASAALGDAPGARRAALRHVDASSYGTIALLDAPRAGSLVRGLIRAGCAHHGFDLVDLPARFARHLGGALPGHDLFLDYCHLTTEGMALAMAFCAGAVLSRLDGEAPAEERLLAGARAVRPSPAVEGRAALGAAIHTAHRLVDVAEGTGALDHWLERALDADPGVASRMEALIEARTAPCAAVLTRAQEGMLSAPSLTLQHGWRWDSLDADLCEAIARALEARGRPARARLDERLATFCAPPASGADLAEGPWHLWTPTVRFLEDISDTADAEVAGTLRAAWPIMRFALPWDGVGSASLTLVARLPHGEGRAELQVNGRFTAEARLGPRWSRVYIEVPGEALRRGLNQVTMRWPIPTRDPEHARREAADRLLLGLTASLHPVFAQIAALRISRREPGEAR